MRFIAILVLLISATASADADGGLPASPLIVAVDTFQGDDTAACTPSAPCKTLHIGLLNVGPQTRRFILDGRQFKCDMSKCNINR